MEHLNESFLGCEEGITNAIKKLGIHAMGVDQDGVRREALDELAMALQCLKTGEEDAAEDIRTAVGDVGSADVMARHGVAAKNTSAPHAGNASPQRKDRSDHEGAEKQPGPPSTGAETAEPVAPFKVFESKEELNDFVLGVVNGVNRSVHDLAVEKSKREMREYLEKEALLESLIPRGHTLVDLDFLNEAHQQACYILERLPDVDAGMELEAELNKAALRLYSRLCLMRPVEENEDFDTSDNDAETAGKAENGSGRVEHGAALEGGAS